MSKPLKGLKVLDLSRALSGPFCTMILGDLGADVIKVEAAQGGDMSRQWGPFDHETSVYYLSANRNKRGLAVDFRSPEGLETIHKIAGQVDIVVENFKVDTVEKMGLGYAELSAVNPRLIMASISGFGSVGPAKDWAGFDQIAQGYSGLMSLTGMPESGPTRMGVAIGDLVSGMWLVIGILSAVVQRERTGQGQKVETSLLAGLMSLLSVQGQRYLSLGEIATPNGNAHPVIAPYGTFDASDGPLNLAPATQAMWERLCDILDLKPLVTDPRFLSNKERMENRAELKSTLEGVLKTKTRMEWTKIMIEAGIPSGPINSLDDVFADAQIAACKLVQDAQHPVIGVLRQVGSPLTMTSLPAGSSISSAPPLLGEHSKDILREFGFEAARIDSLIAGGAIIDAEVQA